MTSDDTADRSETKYGNQIADHDWSTPDEEVEEPERTVVKDHRVEIIYITNPNEDMGYGREKYTVILRYDDETGDPYVLYAIEHRWKGNFWRDITDWNWVEIPDPVRKRVADVLPVDSADGLNPSVKTVDEGGESRWEKIHKPRMEAARNSDDKTLCTVCGVDLTDPKNGGDPTDDGDWVCTDPDCRSQVNLHPELKQ